MKRVITAIFIALIIIAGIAAIAPYAVSSDKVRNEVINKLEALTGREVTFQGKPSLSYAPYLGIEVSNLIIKDPLGNDNASPLLSVEKVKTKLELLALLTGRIEITDYELLRPHISLKTNPDGTENWNFSDGKLHKAIKTNTENRATQDKISKIESVSIGTFIIKDGIVDYDDTIDGTSQTVTNINGKVSWSNTNSAVEISGNGIWHGEGITANTTIHAPLEILSGGESHLTIELNSQPLEFNFTGKANKLANLFLKGEFSATTPSISRFTKVLEINITDFKNFENLSASGQLEATSNNINISDATVEIGQNQATGVLRLSNDELGKYKLDGTLAFENLDLKDYLSKDTESNLEDIFQMPVRNLGVDLRISSQTINIGPIALGDVAASILVDEKSWVLDIGNSTIFDGSLIAKLGERKLPEKPQAFLDISATNINAQSINDLIGKKLISITGQTSFKADMRINKSEDGLKSYGANGSFDGDFTSGQLLGIDLPILLKQPNNSDSETTQLGAAAFNENASTNFDTMKIKLFLNNGAATLSKTELITEEQKIRINGDIDFNDSKLDLEVQEITSEGPKQSRLFISGDVKKPSVSLKNGPNSTN